MKSSSVCHIPCCCENVYTGETRQLETRIKEHKDACIKGEIGKSALA